MSTVTINGKSIPSNNLLNPVIALATRTASVGATVINSAILGKLSAKIDTVNMTVESADLDAVIAWAESKGDEMIHITDDGQDSRERQVTGKNLATILRAAKDSMPYFKKAEELAAVGSNLVENLGTGEKSPKAIKTLSLDF